MLYLIGAGIGESDISIGSIEACRSASKAAHLTTFPTRSCGSVFIEL